MSACDFENLNRGCNPRKVFRDLERHLGITSRTHHGSFSVLIVEVALLLECECILIRFYGYVFGACADSLRLVDIWRQTFV